MAQRGDMVGHGYLPKRGAVRIYNDVDSKDFFFAAHKKSDTVWFVHRDQLQWRKKPTSKAPDAR